MSGREAAKNAIKKRSSTGAVTKNQEKTQGDAKFMGESGFFLHPKTVLLISIIYMGVVVSLHIIGKLR
jgi:hypothetical protein